MSNKVQATEIKRTDKSATRSSAAPAKAAEQLGPTLQIAAEQSQLQTYADPYTLKPHEVLRLQRTIGNRAVNHLLSTRSIQAKLTVGAAHDPYEEEADQVAEQVMRLPTATDEIAPGPHSVRLASEDAEELEAKPLAATLTPVLQRAAQEEDEELQTKRAAVADSFETDGDFERRLHAVRGGGRPLPDTVRELMEPRFGADFSGVRLHTGSASTQLNREISAQAFTLGSDIYLGEGRSDLESNAGQRLLAHELTHVVQQTDAVIRRKIGKAGDGKKVKHASTGEIYDARWNEKHKAYDLFKDGKSVARVKPNNTEYDIWEGEIEDAAIPFSKMGSEDEEKKIEKPVEKRERKKETKGSDSEELPKKKKTEKPTEKKRRKQKTKESDSEELPKKKKRKKSEATSTWKIGLNQETLKKAKAPDEDSTFLRHLTESHEKAQEDKKYPAGKKKGKTYEIPYKGVIISIRLDKEKEKFYPRLGFLNQKDPTTSDLAGILDSVTDKAAFILGLHGDDQKEKGSGDKSWDMGIGVRALLLASDYLDHPKNAAVTQYLLSQATLENYRSLFTEGNKATSYGAMPSQNTNDVIEGNQQRIKPYQDIGKLINDESLEIKPTNVTSLPTLRKIAAMLEYDPSLFKISKIEGEKSEEELIEVKKFKEKVTSLASGRRREEREKKLPGKTTFSDAEKESDDEKEYLGKLDPEELERRRKHYAAVIEKAGRAIRLIEAEQEKRKKTK